MLEDVIPLLLSLVAVVVSVAAFARAGVAFRRESERDHTLALIDLDKMIVEHPELWGLYDEAGRGKDATEPYDARTADRIEAFAHTYLDLHEPAYLFCEEDVRYLRKADLRNKRAWDRYFRELVRSSSVVRKNLSREESERIWSERFFHYARACLREERRLGEE